MGRLSCGNLLLLEATDAVGYRYIVWCSRGGSMQLIEAKGDDIRVKEINCLGKTDSSSLGRPIAEMAETFVVWEPIITPG